MDLTLTTSFDGRFIKQAWELPREDHLIPSPVRTIHQRMVDMEDASVRQALINMGWTPPCQESSTTGADLNGSAINID